MLDIRITGGKVFDGTGSPPSESDIGITGDHISDVGDLAGAEAALTISAIGKIVCPGFIDAHSHSDIYLLIEPAAQSKIHQGITTEVVGNCGASAAPLAGDFLLPSDWQEKDYPDEWQTVAEYRDLLAKSRPAPNVVLLIGHRNLRVGVAGYENRPVTDSELGRMIKLLEQSLEEGGRGLSTGLIYAPAMYASGRELEELARVAAGHNGLYASHMRNEGGRLIESIEETLSIGKKAGVRVQISHLKASGKDNWDLIDRAFETIKGAQSDGIELAADRYPYTSAYTDLDVVLPDWAQEGGRKEALQRLRDPSERARIMEDLRRARPDEAWENVTVGSTDHPDNTKFRGRSLTQAAAELGMHAVDFLLQLIETDELKTTAFFLGMSEDNMMRILAEPYVMIGTDASLRAPTGPLSRDYPHPRAYGSFPRFLRMALDGASVPLPEAIRKMTSLPAAQFRLSDRGTIARGLKADIVVLDAAELRDTATYADPHQLAKGVEHVIVNGVPTIADGCLTGKRGGTFL
jgi:N-acyl-D-amino-acid deacylase